MKKKLEKEEVKQKIEDFFKNIKNKNPKEIKNVKRLAMAYNVPLKEKRKSFCKKCFTPYSEKERTRIKRDCKIVFCDNCNNISRWKIK